MEFTPTGQQKDHVILKEDSLRGLWDIKWNNICIMGENREKRTENMLEEIVAEDFPNLGKDTDVQIQDAQSPEGNPPCSTL